MKRKTVHLEISDRDWDHLAALARMQGYKTIMNMITHLILKHIAEAKEGMK